MMDTLNIIQDGIIICKDHKSIFQNKRARNIFKNVNVDQANLFSYQENETRM